VAVELGAQAGLVIPLIAVHLFVFYYGIMGDITPPVGLATFAAAALSGEDAIQTGIQGSLYALRTVVLPFIWIYNPQLLLIDVDCFKAYNDSRGHPAGDACLQREARAFSRGVQRAGDLVARYGGEEFALVLPDLDREGALGLGERLRAAIEGLAEPHPASPVAAVVTISAGVAVTIPDREAHPGDLVAAADRALYAAKQAGRNRVEAAD
jgi:diguanylate cyclase (GGDEF)-like protein